MEAVLPACGPVATLADMNAMNDDRALGDRSGWVTFAGVMLVILGVLNVIYGIAAIDKATVLCAGHEVHRQDLKTWGWVILILGALEIFAAFSLWSGGIYGRIIGVGAAGLSAISALMSIPAYPFWSLRIFALCIIIIHQICTRGTEGRR